MGHIYLVRHGQASFGAANYDQLSTLGFEQARLLGQWFANCRQGFGRVVTGGMLRHRQSADSCIAELPKSLLIDTEWSNDPGFAEFDHHQVLIRHMPQFDEPDGIKNFMAQKDQPKQAFLLMFRAAMVRWMGGEHDADYDEPWPAFRARCIAALTRLCAEPAPADGKGSTIVFTSGGTISTLVQHVLGLSDVKMMEMNLTLANGGVTRLSHHHGQLGLSYLNNYAHLEWLGEPGSVTYY
ncbi:histidine phosphatase family protein [Oxalobacteraceae bacterium]|nr:histidine phosphatase family protein [Oxalobacteraceae bacterium]